MENLQKNGQTCEELSLFDSCSPLSKQLKMKIPDRVITSTLLSSLSLSLCQWRKHRAKYVNPATNVSTSCTAATHAPP